MANIDTASEEDIPSEEARSSGQRRVEIASILLQNGWDVLVRQIGFLDLIPGGWRQKLTFASAIDPELDEAASILPVPAVMRQTLELLGPTFVKLGQVLSTRADLLPEEYLEELKKLQQSVTPAPWHQIHRVILEEWNKKQFLLSKSDPNYKYVPAHQVEDIYQSFNAKPLAAGSLGQAYRATIKDDDGKIQEVIVKVQRPGIIPIIEADIKVLKDIVKLVERTKWGKAYNFMDMLNEFSTVLLNEMDFLAEASNTEVIGENIKSFYPKGEIHTPFIYWKYCNKRIMTMEFIKGEKLELLFTNSAENILAQHDKKDPSETSVLELERKRLAKVITNGFLHQIFIDGFFHADPHPGNMLLQYDEEWGRMNLVLIDFGMVGRMDPRSRTILIDFLLAIIKFDARRATDRILEFGKAPPDIDRQKFAQDLDHVLRNTLGKPLRDVSVGQILQDILDMTLGYRIHLPGIFITLLRVLITVEGICRQLDRDYILIKAAEPFVVQAIRQQFMQNFSMRDLARLGLEITNLMTRLPRQIDDFVVNLNSGQVRLIQDHRNLEGLERSIHLLGNRVAAGLLVCGMSISSTLTLNIDGPSILGLPLISIGMFAITIILGLWLLNGINKHQ